MPGARYTTSQYRGLGQDPVLLHPDLDLRLLDLDRKAAQPPGMALYIREVENRHQGLALDLAVLVLINLGPVPDLNLDLHNLSTDLDLKVDLTVPEVDPNTVVPDTVTVPTDLVLVATFQKIVKNQNLVRTYLRNLVLSSTVDLDLGPD